MKAQAELEDGEDVAIVFTRPAGPVMIDFIKGMLLPIRVIYKLSVQLWYHVLLVNSSSTPLQGHFLPLGLLHKAPFTNYRCP